MAELGRAALLVTLGLSVYALVAGAAAARLGRRRLALSAQNALVAAFFSTLVASAVLLAALLRNDFSFTYVARTTSEALPTAYTISAFWGGQEGSLLLWLLVLTGFGAAAVRLNRGWARDLVVWVVPVFAARRGLLLVPRRRGREPVRDAGRARRRRRHDAEPPEPVHARAPAAPLPRLRRADRAVRVRARRAPLRPGRRALARRDAPLDALRLDGARRSASCSARTGRTSRWAGAGTTRGTRSRTPRSCRGSRRRRSCTR